MNTLSREITASFFQTAEGFAECMAHFRTLAAAKDESLTSEHYFLYAVLRGKDYRRAFSYATNPHKRAAYEDPDNGTFARAGVNRGLNLIHHDYRWRQKEAIAPFACWLVPDIITRLRAILPQAPATPSDSLDSAYIDKSASPA